MCNLFHSIVPSLLHANSQGYINFLDSIQCHFKILNSLAVQKNSPIPSVSSPVSTNIHEEKTDGLVLLNEETVSNEQPTSPQTNAEAESTSGCVVS